jgi:hypothetical protein
MMVYDGYGWGLGAEGGEMGEREGKRGLKGGRTVWD